MAQVFVDGTEYVPLMPAPRSTVTFGEYLTAVRKAHDLDTVSAAERIGITTEWLADIEADHMLGTLTFDVVVRIGRAYSIDMAVLAAAYELVAFRPSPVAPWDDVDAVVEDDANTELIARMDMTDADQGDSHDVHET